MRTRHPSPLAEPILLGDPTLAEVCASALLHDDNEPRFTHGLHTYPAGLHPLAARDLIAALPGDSLLDPFCGGGTVLIEGRLAGYRTHGRDVSPVALLVSRGRTATPSAEVVTAFRSAGRKIAAEARAATESPSRTKLDAVHSWYSTSALTELEAIRRSMVRAPNDIQPLLAMCFSSILVKVSWRKSDTSARRVKHKRPPGTTAVLFHKKVRELGRALDELREAVPEGTPESDIDRGDARKISLPDSVDLVLTSPPYPSTYDYVPLQQLRAVWFGWEATAPEEIGSRRQFRQGVRWARKRWAEDTDAWTAAAAEQLRPGGHLAIVIGDGLTPSGAIDTSQPTEDAAKKAGLQPVARASVERADHARSATRWEHAFVFRKP
jgi:hypothetical protein